MNPLVNSAAGPGSPKPHHRPPVSRLDPELTRLSPGHTGADTDFFLGQRRRCPPLGLNRTNHPPVVNTTRDTMQLKLGKPPKPQMRQLQPHPDGRL